jgi:hypothetical protein
VTVPARLLVLLAVLATGAGPALAAGNAAADPCTSAAVAKTASYRLALVLGPREDMYLPSEVQARKIKTGQVMLGGEMAMMESTPAGTRIYNLEVHICTKSGAVLTTLKPTIVVSGPAAPKRARLAVAMMAGVAEGLRDYHYGNDVALRPGRRVAVTVTVKGQRAVLQATVPRRG